MPIKKNKFELPYKRFISAYNVIDKQKGRKKDMPSKMCEKILDLELPMNKMFKDDDEFMTFHTLAEEALENAGFTGEKYRDFLYQCIKENPYHVWAIFLLYESYVVSMELDKAREMAWKLISIDDCFYYRGKLMELDDPLCVLTFAYALGDKRKLPEHVINSIKEHEDSLFE